MIESFTPAGCGSRRRRRLALALFTGGALAAAAALGALLGALGALLPPGRGTLVAVAALALAAAAREAGLVRLPLPQVRRQVPDRWRGSLPLPLWAAGYGAGLGAGVFTHQPVATFWVACAGAVALGRPAVAAACFSLYGAGRALMVVLPSRGGDPAAAAERLAARTVGLRRVNAAGLTAIAALLLLVPASAEATPLPLGAGRQLDPAVSAGTLAYTQRTGAQVSVVVRPDPGEPVSFPGGRAPALEDDTLAYEAADGIWVVDWPTGVEIAHLPGRLSRPALEWPWLAFLAEDARGKRLVLVNLETEQRTIVASVGPRGSLGRPALRGGRLAWHVGLARNSRIVVMELQTRRRTVVASSRIASLTHPALSATHVAWIEARSGRSQLLVQELRPGAAPRRVLEERTRGTVLWTTAMHGRDVYVSRWQQPTGLVRINRVRF